jgi:hypothetical protein
MDGMPSIGHVPRVAPARTAPSSATPHPASHVDRPPASSARRPAPRARRHAAPRARPVALVRRDALAPDRAHARRPRTRRRGRAEPAEHLLCGLRQRRRLAHHRLRRQLGADLRRPAHRLHRRDRRLGVEPERDLRGERRGDHPSRPLDRRRDVQVGRCRTHLGAPRAPRDADDRRGRRRSAEPRPALRRGARAPVRPQPGTRRVPLHRRRPDVREGALQGRVHERERGDDRSPRPEHDLRDALAAAAELHRRAGVRRQRDGHLQVHRRRHQLGAAHERPAVDPPGQHRDRAERAEHALCRDRAGAGGDRLLQVHRRRRALVPAGEGREQRTPRGAAGHAPALADRRR